jgi:cystathionine gamma-synthase
MAKLALLELTFHNRAGGAQERAAPQGGVDAKVKLFKSATSLGGTESLIQHQASAPTHGANTGLAENLLRISVGLEHPDDLIADLEQAIRAASDAGSAA